MLMAPAPPGRKFYADAGCTASSLPRARAELAGQGCEPLQPFLPQVVEVFEAHAVAGGGVIEPGLQGEDVARCEHPFGAARLAEDRLLVELVAHPVPEIVHVAGDGPGMGDRRRIAEVLERPADRFLEVPAARVVQEALAGLGEGP